MGRKTTFVIPTALREDLLRECLRSLQRQTSSDFEVIVVSDAAGPWAAAIADEFGCDLQAQPRRLGFAAAVNLGASAADSPYVAILNDDVELAPDWLAVTSSFLDENADVAFCCGKIYGPDRVTLDNAGDAVSLAGSAWRLGHGRKDSPEFNYPRSSMTCPGTAVLIRKSVFDSLGGLDADFISYLEDIDFSHRATRAGYTGCYLPQAQCIHQGGATSGGAASSFVIRMLTRNQLLLIAKNYPMENLLCWLPRILWAQLLWAALAVSKGRPMAYLRGVTGFLSCLPKALKERTPWTTEQRAAWSCAVANSERQLYADVFASDRIQKDTFWKMYFEIFGPSHSSPGTPETASAAASKQGNLEAGKRHSS